MGSRGRVRSGENAPTSGVYSNVDSHYTPMSDEDREIVAGGSNWSTRYFQSSTSFEINDALRTIAETGESLPNALIDAGVWESDVADVVETINTMDRNMRPIDKSMNVVRLVDDDYTDKVLGSLGVSNEVLREIGNIRWSGRFPDSAIKEISDKIIGARVTESGFMSSTYNLSLDDSAFGMRGVKLDFDVPKNTNGMFSPTSSESEFVFARGTKYEFTNVSFDPNDRRLILKVKIVK